MQRTMTMPLPVTSAIAIPRIFSENIQAKNERAGPNKTQLFIGQVYTMAIYVEGNCDLDLYPIVPKSKGNMYSIMIFFKSNSERLGLNKLVTDRTTFTHWLSSLKITVTLTLKRIEP